MNEERLTIRLIPSKGQYRPGEEAQIRLVLEKKAGAADYRGLVKLNWSTCSLHEVRKRGELELTIGAGGEAVAEAKLLLTSEDGTGAYGLFVEAIAEDGSTIGRSELAFDFAEHWRDSPRYGFLSDFAPDETDERDVEFLSRHHVNLVQFYDWMYRHDRLLTEEEVFTDPLGRTISFPVVRRKVEAVRGRGMAAMAYAAVYASLPDYAREHPEQLLYQSDGMPYSLGNYFYIMDISLDSDWTAHFLRELCGAMEWGFDGLQLDQYGFPKKAIRRKPQVDQAAGEELAYEVVELKKLYPALMNRIRAELPEAGLIFNDVGTYPLHTTALAEQDAVYIEVWDPVCRYKDLQELIRRARTLSGKQVVLAAYLKVFHPEGDVPAEAAETSAALAISAIALSGGYHLLLGEQGGVLADPYFPKYGKVSPAFSKKLTAYADFIVMYRHLLFDLELEELSDAFTGGGNNELKFRCGETVFTPDERPGVVWTTVKEKPGYLIIHLLNLTGLTDDVWHTPKEIAPSALEDIEVTLECVERIVGIYCTSPDGDTIRPRPLPWEWTEAGETASRYVRLVLPRLAVWSMLYIQTQPGVPAEVFIPKAFP